MIECEKRQRLVKRNKDGSKAEAFRCLNVKCDMNGQQVTDEQCARCPLAVVFKPRPCNKGPEPCDECREKERELSKKYKDSIKVPEFPALHLQLISWKEAVKKWRAAGKPKRTDKEVANIKENFCNETCSWFDPAKSRCKGCGCKVTEGGVAVFNKIRMATEHCPRDLW
jgi:hypothetical protein